MKRLIELFGFQVHQAPGEAEAECAVLQREGLVDAVMTEDVDTVMFGCGRVIRGWVDECRVYEESRISDKVGISRAGMILVALMSGGDYLPDGVSKCGIKTAVEAAKAGLGDLLLKQLHDLPSWREHLIASLHTNKFGHFAKRHPGLTIPSDFPSIEALKYYANPIVSSRSKLPRIERRTEPDLQGIRQYVNDMLGWEGRGGAERLIKIIAPGLLMWKLQNCPLQPSTKSNSLAPGAKEKPASKGKTPTGQAQMTNFFAASKAKEVSALVKTVNPEPTDEGLVLSIHGTRNHVSTGEIPELRVAYIPAVICSAIDLSIEANLCEAPAPSNDFDLISDLPTTPPTDDTCTSNVPTAKRYDPTVAERIWLPEIVVRRGCEGVVQAWEKHVNTKKAVSSPRKPRTKKGLAEVGQASTLDNYFTKSAARAQAKPSASPLAEPKVNAKKERLAQWKKVLDEGRTKENGDPWHNDNVNTGSEAFPVALSDDDSVTGSSASIPSSETLMASSESLEGASVQSRPTRGTRATSAQFTISGFRPAEKTSKVQPEEASELLSRLKLPPRAPIKRTRRLLSSSSSSASIKDDTKTGSVLDPRPTKIATTPSPKETAKFDTPSTTSSVTKGLETSEIGRRSPTPRREAKFTFTEAAVKTVDENKAKSTKTHAKVQRRLFEKSTQPNLPSRTDKDTQTNVTVILIDEDSDTEVAVVTRPKERRKVIPRTSLNGAWRDGGSDEQGYECEVIDLTSD
ncbi:hypothetical protein SAICODRAFT_77585 [Saitoella complicata NRRL Y-17804]|nr:uncharacterized protein SAICODRAFT_77585 [Saitoella complicata NRRL Y-17804]ODQ54834.1 hypothetical protein SAICODRAFT_77585 [Saitoella complicata NRRL Y-17804]